MSLDSRISESTYTRPATPYTMGLLTSFGPDFSFDPFSRFVAQMHPKSYRSQSYGSRNIANAFACLVKADLD